VSNKRAEQLASEHLRVRFEFCEDRYAHEIWLADGVNWVCVLKSVEGSPLDDWPASPPLQSLHLDERACRRSVALAVGMAGKSHWSASIELDEPGRSASFDIAWRGRGPIDGLLGTSYELVQAQLTDHCGIRRAVFNPNTSSSARLAVELEEQPGRVGLRLASAGIKVVAGADASHAAAQTVRWSYKLTWLSAGTGP
jgi:hypothetical protein